MSAPKQSVPFDLLGILEKSGVSFVFWTCPNREHRGVTWNAEKTVATCDVCGKKSTDKLSGQHGALPP